VAGGGEETAYVLKNLRIAREAGKLVLVIDYPRKRRLVSRFFKRVKAEGFIGYAPDRAR